MSHAAVNAKTSSGVRRKFHTVFTDTDLLQLNVTDSQDSYCSFYDSQSSRSEMTPQFQIGTRSCSCSTTPYCSTNCYNTPTIDDESVGYFATFVVNVDNEECSHASRDSCVDGCVEPEQATTEDKCRRDCDCLPTESIPDRAEVVDQSCLATVVRTTAELSSSTLTAQDSDGASSSAVEYVMNPSETTAASSSRDENLQCVSDLGND